MHVKNSNQQLWTTEPQFQPHLGLLLSIRSCGRSCWNYSPLIKHLPSFTLLLSYYCYFYIIWRTAFGSYAFIPLAAASSHDKIRCCLHSGCNLFLLPFLQEKWKCIPCLTPTPAPSSTLMCYFSHSLVLHQEQSLSSRSFLFISNQGRYQSTKWVSWIHLHSLSPSTCKYSWGNS